ncbi:MAG TPA: hydantoinase/oxoprolinase family protein [Methylovirgula sp.]|jgi:probable H4MPT-linked C1 transfer pathway protein
MQSIIGWDIGGAHLKAARLEAGRIVKVVQIASPLWEGIETLHRAFADAKAALGPADLNAVTMTAELADAFQSRDEGVARVAEIAEAELAPHKLVFYAGPAGMIERKSLAEHARQVASANWHASAAFAARRHPTALFTDMGSTTTDLIPIRGGKVAARGYSDAERMAEGELVYAGVVRSFLMAGVQLVPFRGRFVPLMNEWFANMSDVYRILGELPEDADVMQTADQRDKSVQASMARLARQIGRDASDAKPWEWTQLAHVFAEAQLRTIIDGAHLLLSHQQFSTDIPLIGAGVGRFVLKRLAQRLGFPYVDFGDLFEVTNDARTKAGDCAPACAVALLALGNH